MRPKLIKSKVITSYNASAAYAEISNWAVKQISISFRAGTRAFFLEVAKTLASQSVIDTGMSAASMIPLATKVRMADEIHAIISANKKSNPVKPYRTITGTTMRDGWRSMAQGRREAETLGARTNVIVIGTKETPRWRFVFNIVIWQWAIWEKKKWHALKAGRIAFKATFREELKNRIKSKRILQTLRGK